MFQQENMFPTVKFFDKLLVRYGMSSMLTGVIPRSNKPVADASHFDYDDEMV
jgi:hypothetical protein